MSEVGAPGAAEEILATARRRGWSGRLGETAPEICDLVTGIAGELLGKPSDPAIADLTAGPGRLLTTLSAAIGPRAIHYAETDPAMAKVLRLRLFCHGHRNLVPHPDGEATTDFAGADVAFVDPPFQPGEHEQRDEHPLSWAARVVECLSGDGIGFAVVPEWTLTRAAIARRLPVTWTREQLIRRGCVRAIIQLPRHLHPFNTGADLALLVLNADDGDSTRQVVMCNAAAIRTRSDQPWVQRTTDMVCRPTSAREAELCRTFPVANLVGRRSLLPAHLLTPESTAPDDYLLGTIRARESAISTFATSTDGLPVLQRIAVTTRTAGTSRRTVGELLRGGQLIRLPGHRIPAGDLGDNGQRVLGREELLGLVPIGQRRIDVVNLGKYSAAAITEPGDVVIMAGERLQVMVDETGGSVLLTPVQGLRIPGYVKHSSVYRDEPQRAWIGPHALAALLGAARNAARTGTRVRSTNLQQLDIPVLTSAEYDHLDETALLLTELAEQARRQAAALDLVRQQLATSLAAGALSLRLKPSTTTPNTRGDDSRATTPA
ncbi:class I SAM-dependent methyltransferase [Dactylosporangium darangshiense]|uniref:class I SAM-dependent methyltransferase n=1 Tax=Dactylosporangium darangshiense TaxID=579108 RepID=UPI0031ED52E2